jgi:hypothetical protein
MSKQRPSGINPPYNRTREDPASKWEVYEAHKNSGINAYYDLYPEARPRCSGDPGCACRSCCRMRGHERDR